MRVELYDIKNNPQKIQYQISQRANELNNDLYILTAGNHFELDYETCQALRILCSTINFYVLDKR